MNFKLINLCLLTFIAVVFCNNIALAESEGISDSDFTVDNINYTILSDNTCKTTDSPNATGYLTIPSYVTNGDKTYTVVEIGSHSFYMNDNITNIFIPSTVLRIGEYGIYSLKIPYIEIPLSVNELAPRALAENHDCVEITGMQNVATVGDDCFSGCSKLTNINLPSVEILGTSQRVFGGCSSLTSITLGQNTKSVCNLLERAGGLSGITVKCNALLPPTYLNNSGYDETDALNRSILIVPESSVNSYKAAEGWKNFGKFNPVLVSGINFDSPSYTMYVGESLTLNPQIFPSNAENNTITWSSSNNRIAFVDSNGIVTAKEVGVCNITACCGDVRASCQIDVSAMRINIEGISYVLSESTAKVIGCTICGNIFILETVTYENKVYEVNKIGSYAFQKNEDIDEVTLPNTIISIGEGAFSYSTLRQINIPESVTWIGVEAFDECPLDKVYCSGQQPPIGNGNLASMGLSFTKIYVPTGCKDIYKSQPSVFASYKYFIENPTKIGDLYYIINDDTAVVTRIEESEEYSDLVSLEIPEVIEIDGNIYRINEIGNNAFKDCLNISSVRIPNSVKSIGSDAFSGCKKLSLINIPSSVTFIGQNAFKDASATSIHVDIESLEAWCKIDFENYYSNPKTHLYIDGKFLDNLIIPSSISVIKDFSFIHGGYTSLELPNSITYIGECNFREFYNLTSVKIPNSVTSIGERAFATCKNLRSVSMSNSVTSIGSYAFNNCESLRSVKLSGSIHSIGDYAFSHCDNLREIFYDSNDPMTFTNKIFQGTTSSILSQCLLLVPRGAAVKANARMPWKNASKKAEIDYELDNGFLVSVDKEKKTCSIDGYNASNDRLALPESVIIENENFEITSIGESAFGFLNIYFTQLPKRLESIGAWAFAGNRMPNINIPNSVSSIGYRAFFNSNVNSVKIPASYTSSGGDSFGYNDYFRTLYYLTNNPIENVTMITNNYSSVLLYVLKGQKEILETMKPWKQFTKIIEVILGDVDNDGNIVINDAINTANFVVGKNVSDFHQNLADLNDDYIVTISDALAIVNLSLDQPIDSSLTQIKSKNDDNDDSDAVIINDFVVDVGKQTSVDVYLNNSVEYVALQADVYIPEGMTFESVAVGGRAANHTLMSREIGDNIYRIVIFNFENIEFADNSEALFKLNFTVNDAETEDIVIDNIIASDTFGNGYRLSSYGGKNLEGNDVDNVIDNKLELSIEGNNILVSNVEGMNVSVYTVDGKMIDHRHAESDRERITLPAGVYIVVAGTRTAKVVVK